MINRTSFYRAIQRFSFSLSFVLLAILTAQASEPVVWETNSRAELLSGEARGISVTDTGTLMLAPRFTSLFDTEQAYIWSSAIDAAGTVYLGTGHDGRIFRVGPDGRGSLLFDSAELEVTALVIGKDGALYAGTSPDGKVYRVGLDGKAETYFDPPDKYVWSLAVLSDGALAVGTGDNGKLYRVRAAGAKAEDSLLIDTNETHVISLAVDAKGNLIAGTDPGGLVLRISPEGKAFALYDSPLREMHALVTAADGSIYALALSDAASRANSPVGAPAPQPTTSATGGASGTATVTTVTVMTTDDSGQIGGAQAANKSRNDLQNARSAVFRILPDGGTDVLWSSPSVTAFTIVPSPQGGSVLIGTSDKGRIYSVTNDGRDTLLIQSSEDQISSLISRGGDVFAASSNQGKLFRFGSELINEGTYESSVRDAKLVAAWGRIWWRGRGQVEVQTRSGNTERPDVTWSEWSAAYREASGAQISSPRARFIQWRVVLHAPSAAAAGKTRNSNAKANAETSRVEGVSVAYLPRNVAPEVLSIQTLPPGVSLQQALQVSADPNIEASGLDPSILGTPTQVPPRKTFQRGVVSLQWQAEDRNGDEMEYSIFYRSVDESGFHLLKDKLRENFFAVDGASLGDGRYIFKVVASDAPENPLDQAMTGERISEPVDIDSSPPAVRALDKPQVTTDRVRVRFQIQDTSGMIKRADASINGGAWRPIFPEDGIADSSRETYTLDLPLVGTGEHTITVRGFDKSGNVGSARVIVSR